MALEPDMRAGDPAFELEFPRSSEGLTQDQEWCVVRTEDDEKRIRFHDYGQIYAIPGLYEELFYEKLKCCSPTVVCNLLEKAVATSDAQSLSDFTVLDLGAGNGMVGEELKIRGVSEVVGVDLIPEAAEAACRDRPGTYSDYLVEDLTDLDTRTRERLEAKEINCLTTVAALGFGDIPPQAFAEAFNLVDEPGWVAFNIRDRFLETGDSSGFSRLIERMIDEGVLDSVHREKYRHRLASDGEPLYYYAFAARKVGAIPVEWIEEAIEETVA
jgi:hypothetical protein